MLSFKIILIISSPWTEPDIHKEHLLDDIIRASIEAHIEGTWAEKLIRCHMRQGNSIDCVSATWLEEVIVAAWCHINIENFTIVIATHNDIFEVDRATGELESLSGIVLVVLL